MLLYRFRIWQSYGEIQIDDDVYTQEIGDETVGGFHQPNEVYQIIVPPEKPGDPTLHLILSDNREKITEYIRGFSLGIELIPSKIPIEVTHNPFRVAESAEVTE